MPDGVASVPHCCSEAGTLALSRPDIAAAMLEKKRASLAALSAGPSDHPPMITNCPACLNGLGRQRRVMPKHLAVALADALNLKGWKAEITDRLGCAELVRF